MSKNDSLNDKPASVVGILNKLIHPSSISNTELLYIIDKVFLPSINKNYFWIRNVHGTMQDSNSDSKREQTGRTAESEGVNALPPENNVPSYEADDRDFIETEDLDRNETVADLNVLDAESSSSGIPDDPVCLNAINELWIRFSNVSTSSNESLENPTAIELSSDTSVAGKCPNKTIWEKALDCVQNRPPDVAEKEAIRYLRTCAAHEIAHWCSETSLYSLLRGRLSSALKCDLFDRTDTGKQRDAYCFLANEEPIDTPEMTPELIKKICKTLVFANLECGSKYYSQPLPSATILRALLMDLFSKTRFAFRCSDLINIIKEGWDLREMKSEPLPDENNDETEGIHRGLSYGPSGEKNFSEAPEYNDNSAIRIASEIKDAVLLANKQPLTQPVEAKKGKLGRLFTEFFLWKGLPAEGTLSGNYGIEKYAEHTGYAKSTEHDRYTKKLKPMIRNILVKYYIDHDTFYDVILLLRTEFLNLKPEFVQYDAFGGYREELTHDVHGEIGI